MSTTIFAMTHKKFIPPKDTMYVPLHVGKEGKEEEREGSAEALPSGKDLFDFN